MPDSVPALLTNQLFQLNPAPIDGAIAELSHPS